MYQQDKPRKSWEAVKQLPLEQFLARYGRYLLLGAAALMLAVGGAAYFLGHWPAREAPAESAASQLAQELSAPGPSPSSAASGQAPPDGPAEEEWYVDVKGAVHQPQMVRVQPGMRVQDALDLAGGMTEEADVDRVNLSQRLADQMLLFVPRQGEELPEAPASSPALASGGPAASSASQININTADSQELQKISGIGEKKAADIIAYREANGSFQSVDQLTQVSGIGEKTLEKIRPQVTVN